jgi:hypothetical protein
MNGKYKILHTIAVWLDWGIRFNGNLVYILDDSVKLKIGYNLIPNPL